MPQSHGNFCQVKAGNKSDLIKLRKEIYPKQFMYGTKFLESNRHAPKTKLVGWGMNGEKKWYRMLPKGMGNFVSFVLVNYKMFYFFH
jgi:hypothetical protein